jgi:hypothetical protein
MRTMRAARNTGGWPPWTCAQGDKPQCLFQNLPLSLPKWPSVQWGPGCEVGVSPSASTAEMLKPSPDYYCLLAAAMVGVARVGGKLA